MSILQLQPGPAGAQADSALNTSSLTSTRVVLRSVHDLLDRCREEFLHFDFKLKERLDPLIHLAELTVLPCAYACYQASSTLEHGLFDSLSGCPLGVSSREETRSFFRFHTRGELKAKELSTEMKDLRAEILAVFREARIEPERGQYIREGYSDLGFLAGTLVYELTEGALLPVGKCLSGNNFHPVTEWNLIESKWLDTRVEESPPSISELYSFLWRGFEFAHLQDPISSVTAFSNRLRFQSARVRSDAVVVWEPSTYLSPESQSSLAAVLIEENHRNDNFRPLLVTWLHHTKRGREYGEQLDLLSADPVS